MAKVLIDSNYTCHQIANILSLNLSIVRLWINRGWRRTIQNSKFKMEDNSVNLMQGLITSHKGDTK
ncbi:hypothetical protein A6770_32140 [Nostoc minutum NIES-26]|uniref:Uncharacterized protein n=1 Tax=Nostoc minutum NIES-26 TaxID=1844469 RepID=A0A367Q570_9NOSO|nr:hypothetical protein A6770_32140 [Nostoc minutum NIES-26]